jgi:hypothetical protein
LIEDLRAQHVYDLLKEHNDFGTNNPPKDDPRLPLIARLEWEPEIAHWGPATVQWAQVKVLMQSLGENADNLELSGFMNIEKSRQQGATRKKIATDQKKLADENWWKERKELNRLTGYQYDADDYDDTNEAAEEIARQLRKAMKGTL